MAEDTRQANVVLTADANQYSQAMAAASAQTNAAASSVDKLVNSLDRLQRNVSRKLDIISAVSISGITAATLAAAKFESQMETLQATAAITGKSFGAVEKSVDNLRRTLPVSTEQIVQLVTALQKMGVSTPKVEELAKTFIKLGAATGEDVGSLATGLVSLQRAMGTTEGSIKSFADETAHLSANLGVSATGILQFAQQLAPVARTVGMTQTQVMGFSTAFLKAGQDGYAAANVFSKLLTDISRATRYGSNDIYAYANAVGMTAEQFKKLPAAEQATQFFSAVSRQGADAIKTLERLGYDGPRALKAIQGMAQSGALGRSLGEAEAGFNSGDTEKGAKAAMDGLNDSLKMLQNTLTSIGQTFGKTFLPFVTAAVKGINVLASAVRSLMDPLSNMLSKFAVIGSVASGVASLATTGVGVLAAAGGAYALLRNPLTAGFMSRRAERTGSRMSAFTRNTAANMETRGSPWQRRFFGIGQGLGNRYADLTVGEGQTRAGQATSPWARARQEFRQGLSRMAQDAINVTPPRFYRGDEPLLPGQQNAQGGRRYPWTGMRFGQPGGPDLLPEREAGDTFRRGLHLRGLGGRVAMGVSGVYQGALGMARQQFDPLRWAGTQDATARPGYSWKESGDTLRRAWTGEGAGVAKSMQLMQQANVRFVKALGDATLGLGRLAVGAGKAAAGPMIRTAMSNVQGVAKGAFSMLGGPIGVGLMAGTAAMGYAGSLNSQAKAFQERITDTTAEDSAVNKYATAMGLASSAALSFSDTVTRASNQIEVTSAERARAVMATDIKLATSTGRKMTDESFSRMSTDQARQYAASVFSVEGADPKIMQAMKLDLIDQFGIKPATDIINQASAGQNLNVSSLVEGYRTGIQGEGGGGLLASFKAPKKLTQSLTAARDTYSTTAGYLRTQFGDEEAQKYSVVQVNQMLQKLTGNTSTVQAQQIAATIESMSGVTKGGLKIGTGDLASIQNASTPQGKRQAYYDILFNSELAGGPGGDFRRGMDQYGDLTTYNRPAAGQQSNLYSQLGVYGTAAGTMLKSNIGTGKSLQAALASPNDENAQLQAATEWGQQLTTMTGSTTAANLELQNLKARINDVNDPLYAMAQAAQQAAARLQGYQSRYQGRGENARTTAGNLATAYVSQGPDRQKNIIAAEDAYEEARSGLYEQFKTIVRAYREFDIQQGRSVADFNKQRARSDQDYNRQRKYGEMDYYESKVRAQESFDKQRRRSEQDYQHQIEQQIRQNAKSMQSVYERITTKPTWDAQNLLTNSRDQLAKMQQQQRDLATVRGLGLSGDAIDQLGLNEFGNQQQLARMVGDLGENPDLIRQWNEAVAGKLDISKAFVTDKDSDSWKEMERQYQLSLTRMAEDFTLMNAQGEADYKKSLDRQNLAYAESMKRTGEDFHQQLGRAREDLNRSFEEITGSFTEMADAALGQLSGVTQAQYTALNTALGLSRDQIKAALQGTNDDMIKLLAPLFGGEEAARKALASAATNKVITSPSAEWNMNKGKGGGYGSEASYDSMSASAGGGTGGMGGANFPLPAGSWVKSSGFGMRMNPVLHRMMLHAGTDLAVKSGTPVGAAEDGIVTKAQVMGGLGNMVEVSHNNGTKTWYGHMSLLTAKKGDLVSAGSQIGLSGNTGNSTGPHLHFERHVNGTAVDPWGYLQGLSSGLIQASPWGAGAMGLPGVALNGSPVARDVMSVQSVKDVEKGLSTMTPGGMAYTPGLFPTALQTRIDGLTGNTAMDSIGGDPNLGSYYGGSSVRTGSTAGSYVRGGVVMDTKSITTVQHIDNGTDFNGGIVVVAQDPDEMGRKLAEKKRMKALTRPSRSA